MVRVLRRAWTTYVMSYSWLGLLALSLGCSGPTTSGSRLPHQKTMVMIVEKPVVKMVKVPATKKEEKPKLLQVKAEEKVKVDVMDKAPPTTPVPHAKAPRPDRLPIDLASALRLAGGNNLQIAIAIEEIQESQAKLDFAAHQWLPSLQFGVGYNNHDGQIQATPGQVIDARRQSFFIGGGPNLGSAPLTGGAGGPARLFVGLPLADVIFEPLAQRQQLHATLANQASVFNDTLLQVTLAYLDLVQAEGQLSIAEEATSNAQRLLDLVEKRVKAGQDLPADSFRAKTELSSQRREKHQAEEAVRVASAELVRLLRLDPSVILFPLESMPTQMDLIKLDTPVGELVAQGIAQRPEVAQAEANVQERVDRADQEKWRPWIPSLQIGLSAGGFGGGPNGFFGNFGDRTDFDALAVWEIRNLGFGNHALQRQRMSQLRQAKLRAVRIRDIIAAEIAQGYHRIQTRSQQISAAKEQVEAAAEALPLNFKGIFGGDLRAIEAQQAVQMLAEARRQYLSAIVSYNRAQFELIRAMGSVPPAAKPKHEVIHSEISPEPVEIVPETTKPQVLPGPQLQVVPHYQIQSRQPEKSRKPLGLWRANQQ